MECVNWVEGARNIHDESRRVGVMLVVSVMMGIAEIVQFTIYADVQPGQSQESMQLESTLLK
jgi:predicted negative regulator of RcsB-dependent stress response